MADQVGRAALTIGGAFFFGPVGAIAGGILGDILFPQKVQDGPRLNELNVQQSTVGAPIPIVYGTVALAGNVIWSGGLTETEHEGESGGKGGPSGPSTYSYAVDVAIGICEGPIDGVRRIWADADLIYDSSDDATLEARLEGTTDDVAGAIEAIRVMSSQLTFELYTGTESQLPDPTIESYEGAGNVPGFRGLAYIVFPQFQLEKFGNRIPNFRFEVYAGDPAECGIYSAGVLYPWLSGVRDPRNPLNNHVYSGPEDGYGGGAFSADIDYANRNTNLLIDHQIPSVFVHAWSVSTTPNGAEPCNTGGALAGATDYVGVSLMLNYIPYSGAYYCHAAGDTGVDHTGTIYLNNWPDGLIHWNGTYDPPQGFSGNGLWYTDESSTLTPDEPYCGPLLNVTDALISPPFNRQICGARDQELVVKRDIQPSNTWALTWTLVSGSFHVLRAYAATGGGLGHVVTSYPVDPAVPSTDPNYNDQDYWEAAYAADQASGDPQLDPGLVYGVDYPESQSFAYFSECTAVTVDCVQMADIVADICRRSGLRTDTGSQIDVSDLTTCVPGYVIGRQMSGRDALGPLRVYGLWDCVESGALLKFIERGHAIGVTLTDDDLGVHEAGSQAPSLVEVSRIQEKDLPRRVRLHFANFLHDHEPSEQSASRITTEAIDELDVELPISMEPDTAKQLAEISLYAQWVGRNTFRISLDNSRLALEPTDCIEIPVDGETERVRITAVDYSIGGIMRVEAVRDDDGSYISTAVANPSQPSGGVPGSNGNGPICPSEVVLLDLPRLRDQDTDAGYYAAIYGEPGCPSWTCAELHRSADGGATYARVARTDLEATVGTIVDITGPPTDYANLGDSPQYDASNSITVSLFHGTLSSVTDAQIDAGYNSAAIGVDGRWVIIQFKTATLTTVDTYVLTDLIWGLRDTGNNLGTTTDGDTFVLLNDAALLRIPETPANIGVERQLKAVTCGQSVDDADTVFFTTWGLSYLRLCPSTVISATITDPPVSPADGDAYLLPNDTSLTGLWETHGGEIATWSDDTDNWVYCTPVPGTIVTISGDEDVISGGDGTYTAAPWTPAIPPLDEATPVDTDYFVFYDGTGYKKGQLSTLIGGGGFDTSSDTSDIGIALDELTDVAINTPLEGDVLTYNGSSGWVNAPLGSIPGGGGGAEYVGGTTLGSDGTTITVSGLDLDTDGTYLIRWNVKGAGVGTWALGINFNGVTTVTDYTTQLFTMNGGSAGAGSLNNPYINNSLTSTLSSAGTATIFRNMEGRPFCYGTNNVPIANNPFTIFSHIYNTSANVTRISMVSSVASNLLSGSSLHVWRMPHS